MNYERTHAEKAPLRVVLVDDDQLILQSLREILDWTASGCVLAGSFENPKLVLQSMASLMPDLIITDIRMPQHDGLELMQWLHQHQPQAQVIVISAYNEFEYAISAMRLGALDYLLKPVEPADVERALDKAVRRLSSRSCAYLALKLPNGTASISTNDITYVEVFDHNLVYHTTGGDYTVRGRLGDVYEQLDHDYFLACNRSFIVNLRYVTEICTDHVILNGTKISVSKSHRKEIQSRFSAFMDKRAEKV